MGGILDGECRPICPSGGDGRRHDRNSFHLSPGQEPGEGDCPPLVVPQPLPRLARPATMPRMYATVTSASSVCVRHLVFETCRSRLAERDYNSLKFIY